MPALRADVDLIGRLGIALAATGGDADPGPGADFDLGSIQALARYRVLDQRRWRGAAMAGLELVDFQAAQSGSATFHRSRTAIGPAVGIDLGWTAIDPVEVYGRGTFGALLESTSSLRGEIGLRTPIERHADIFVAYRWWQVEQEDLDILLLANPRELKLRVEGLVFGMTLRF